MPYKTNWKSRYVTFEYFGKVTSQDIIKSNTEAYGDPRFDLLRWQLVSFEEAESVAFQMKDVRLIAHMDKAAARSNPKISVAFVGTAEILKEVEDAYESVGAGPAWPTFHFDSCEEARAYITQGKSVGS